MVPIPDRTALAAMLRPDIQKLCKDNNIKANMRTEDMIDALCGLATGEDVPRTQRAASIRTASVAASTRTASVSSRPPSAKPASPKKALQPSESNTDAESATDTPTPAAPTTRRKAREIQTHLGKGRPAVAGGSGARAITKRKKTSAAVPRRHDPIPEEDEENAEVPKPEEIPPRSPTQLPTPAPSHPSHSLPSAVQVAALEARITALEGAPPDSTLQARLSALEASTVSIPALEARTAKLEQDLAQHVAHLERVEAENVGLKERVAGLEARLEAQSSVGKRIGSMVIHPEHASLDVPTQHTARLDLDSTQHVTKPVDERAVLPSSKRIGSLVIHPEQRAASPAPPSPGHPMLGKRTRSDDTPDATPNVTDDAIERIIRPVRKRARVGSVALSAAPDLLVSSGTSNLAFHSAAAPFAQGPGPSSTSTPRAPSGRSDSPPGFFTAGRRVPTPLARRPDDDVDVDIDAYLNLEPESEAQTHAKSSEAGPSKPPDAVPGVGFFGSPPPGFPGGHTTPSPSSPEMYTTPTPVLGAPWTPPPPTPTQFPALPHTPLPERERDTVTGAEYVFRGGRRERNDRYQPYFTPGGQRTGYTPPALGSPAKVHGDDEEGEERLRTLYGTELGSDLRFGDFGRVLGWGAGDFSTRGGKK